MTRLAWLALLTALATGACAKAPDGSGGTTAVAEEAPSSSKTAGAAPAVPVSVPQIAYVYRYAYTIPADAIATVQERHIALCDRLGPDACRVVGMQRVTDEASSASGSLTLVVRAQMARAFSRALAAAVARSGGSQADSSIAAEDLSKRMIDTEARLRAKQALADRLMELLRTRSGPVADLVAAERSVAGVQEEIDAARSWLAEARGRVDMSTFELSYGTTGTTGFSAPLRQSIAAMGGFFGGSLALLIQLVAVLLPWAVAGGAVAVAARWMARRRRRVIDED
ncbi:DUF4349 domain-containing protein [Sphingomonas profundi]|uniref:DUF4349 domain-containing protein n=1 Tax=Alterirhizorhabdus profundi TaxID=2681549 RepID=UPI0012E97CA6|nr:DUF4349 domain-containing protein [Sphingomonas profundi]